MVNRSAAVLQQRKVSTDGADYYPTPPPATRALCNFLRVRGYELSIKTCWEPAAGGGHMADVLNDYFLRVRESDIVDREGRGFDTGDFLGDRFSKVSEDWIITNPPFKLGQEFVLQSLLRARVGVAVLLRIAFAEGRGRYKLLFSRHPPRFINVFVNRVVMMPDRLPVEGESSAICFAWFVWEKGWEGPTEFNWHPESMWADKDSLPLDWPGGRPPIGG